MIELPSIPKVGDPLWPFKSAGDFTPGIAEERITDAGEERLTDSGEERILD